MSGHATSGGGAAGTAGAADADADAAAVVVAGDAGAAGGDAGDVAGGAAADERPLVIRRRGRRVTTEAPTGYAGEPPAERQQSSENDARLRGDVPPHWG